MAAAPQTRVSPAVATEERTSPQTGLIRVPGWSSLPWLVAAFSTRFPGQSNVYGSHEQNLGWTAEDDPVCVGRNRRDFLTAVWGKTHPALCTLKQIHSSAICNLDEENLPGNAAADRPAMEGDGMLTNRPGRLLGILTADCVPVLLADTRTRAIGAFHAGWRGTLAGIVGNGADTMHRRYGSQPQHLVAAIGPAIRPCCFRVGEEVRAHFFETFPYAAELFSRPEMTDGGGQLRLDLQAANRRQLLEAGLTPSQIVTVAECTACSRLPEGGRKYFSYRAEGGRTGRMLSVIGVC